MKKVWKQRYQIIEKIGKGGNGQVYRVWDLHLEKEWAMKILQENYIGKAEGQKKGTQIEEWQVLKKINHPNFPRIVDAFEEENRKILIMDYIHGVTLEKVLERGALSERKILELSQQIAEGILYLHQQNPVLLYMDLKPSNIIVEENGNIKLVDLGSVIVKGSRGNVSGSLGFASPEQVKVQNEGRMLKEQSDIFSFGLVLFVMASGECHRIPLIEAKSRRGVFVRKDNPSISVALEKIIEKCTRGNPEKRYSSMREVIQELYRGSRELEKRKSNSFLNLRGQLREKKQWYQEKSIFCTEGKHSFYIAKRILILLLGVLYLLRGKMIYAEEYEEHINKRKQNILCELKEEELFEKRKKTITQEGQLEIVIRDAKLRKVLVKQNCSYETKENLLLEIPWEEIEGENYRIWVECEDESRQKKQFFIECIYEK